MKFWLIADPHLEFLGKALPHELESLKRKFAATEADACLMIGDMDSGVHPEPNGCDALLSAHPHTMWILGNHDLWTMQDLTPPEAMAAAIARHHQGQPLETSWTRGQVVDRAGVTFVGTMGFPDFKHPMLSLPVEWYDCRSATNDANFIDLRAGWVKYTVAMQRAFFKRLQQAFDGTNKDVVVATHYPILDVQSRLNPNDVETWPYFFNWTIGQKVLELARRHPEKRVLCVAGHSHDYCTGVLKQAGENVWGYGAQGQYGRIALWLFDTELWRFVERVKSKRGPYRQAIEDEADG